MEKENTLVAPEIHGVAPAPPNGCPRLKTKIWKSSIPPKLKHFLWRVLSSALSSGSELGRRGIPVDSTCQRCHQHEESIKHLLFSCPYAQLVWENSNHPIRSLLDDSNSLEANVAALLSPVFSDLSDEQRYLPFWILWHIWKSRNDLIFNKISWELESIIRKAKDDVLEWTSAEGTHHHQFRQNSAHRNGNQRSEWSRPNEGWIKVNYDGSFNYHNGRVGAGWVIRDARGQYCSSGYAQLNKTFTPLEAESLALLYALQVSWFRGYRRIVLEGDCKILYDILNNKLSYVRMEHLITDIRSWADHFMEISFSLISRDANNAADRLAKSAYNHTVTSQSYVLPPFCIRSHLSNGL